MPNLPDILNGVQEAAGSNPVTRTRNVGESVKTAGSPNFFVNTYFYKTSSDLRYCYSIATPFPRVWRWVLRIYAPCAQF